MNEFKKFNINDLLIEKLNQRNISIPTDIQNKVIPKILKGEDVIAQSKTGTGKTIAYLVPLIDLIIKKSQNILIIAPTKELARQIHNEVEYFTQNLNIKSILLISGDHIEDHIKKLKYGHEIIVGVPGRIIKLIKSGDLKLGNVKKIIFDETDFLIDLGFLSDIKIILEYSKNINQLMIFSATLSAKTKKIIDIVRNQKYTARVDSKNSLPVNIENYFFPVNDENREKMLYRIISVINPYLSIIFVRTKDISNYLYKRMKEKNLKVSILNGSLTPSERKRNIKEFSEAKTQYLVSTDLASRGIDIAAITHIINFNLPVNELDYLHRAGRTGRMGDNGIVFSLCNELDEGYLKKYAAKLEFKLYPAGIINNKIEINNKYSGVKPRFNLNELKKMEKIKNKKKKAKGAKNAKKKKRSR